MLPHTSSLLLHITFVKMRLQWIRSKIDHQILQKFMEFMSAPVYPVMKVKTAYQMLRNSEGHVNVSLKFQVIIKVANKFVVLNLKRMEHRSIFTFRLLDTAVLACIFLLVSQNLITET